MIIDARTIDGGSLIETGACIIGAGAAGITLARELIRERVDVALLESGGLEYEDETQNLYDGDIVGRPYTPLTAARMRMFGGTTNHWAGFCRPLDDIDFQKRPWIPYSGWPFSKSELEPFYERAREACQLGRRPFHIEAWENEKAKRLKFVDETVVTTIFQFSPPTRFGKVYQEELSSSPHVKAFLHANVLQIETDQAARNVTLVRVACLDGKTFSVKARVFVLAAGGIENPRLLLLSNNVQDTGLGNQHGLVGRFFMDHVGLQTSEVLFADARISTSLYHRVHRGNPGLAAKIDGGSMEQFLPSQEDKKKVLEWIRTGAAESRYHSDIQPLLEANCIACHNVNGVAFFRPLTTYESVLSSVKSDSEKTERPHTEQSVHEAMAALTLSAQTLRTKSLINFCTLIKSPEKISLLHHIKRPLKGILRGKRELFWQDVSRLITSLDEVTIDAAKMAFGGGSASVLYPVTYIIEPSPNPSSRVKLSTSKDRFGQNKVELDWRLNPEDLDRIIKGEEVIAAEFGRAGLGRIRSTLQNDQTTWPSWLEHGWHHMGTTRMHEDPKQGVVDGNCLVHGLTNLFVAGSSVFPTYGFSQPTYTIVALAIRLADHIREVLK